MQKRKICLVILMIAVLLTAVSGCWNYREIDRLSIVAGIAVDKGVKEQYCVTVEVIRIGSSRNESMKSEIVSSEGKTLFDAIRNIISISGKRLYWSHTKVVILSQEIAGEGVSKVLELYNRDTETREDVHVLISQEKSAREIFTGQPIGESILSFTLDEILDNQVSLSKAPKVDILRFDIESQEEGAAPVIPAIRLQQVEGKKVPQIIGTAIIKNDKLAGFLDGEETKDLLFIRDEIQGGIFIEEMQEQEEQTSVSLEIFGNNTKVTMLVKENGISVNLDLKTTVAISEVNGVGDFTEEENMKKLKQHAQDTLKRRLETLILKMQKDYDADVFGFSSKLWQDNAQAFKGVSDRWDDVFQELKVTVRTEVLIKNSAILTKPIGEGE